MAEFSIVVPACNEADTLEAALTKLENKVRGDYEIIVVDDHSLDKTKEIALKAAGRYNNITVVENKGQGSFVNAICCGIAHVKTAIFVPVMADLCDDPETINAMFEQIKQGYDIVVGSRYGKGGRRLGGSSLKAFLSRFMGISLHFLIGIPTYDIANAFKMYRKNILEKITIESKGFDVSAEIPIKAFLNGARITEVPTIWQERKQGKSHFKMLKTGPGYICLYVWAIGRRVQLWMQNQMP